MLRHNTGRTTRDERGLTGEHVRGVVAQALLVVTGLELGGGACVWWPAVARVLISCRYSKRTTTFVAIQILRAHRCSN
jgi:hypothetical protein